MWAGIAGWVWLWLAMSQDDWPQKIRWFHSHLDRISKSLERCSKLQLKLNGNYSSLREILAPSLRDHNESLHADNFSNWACATLREDEFLRFGAFLLARCRHEADFGLGFLGFSDSARSVVSTNGKITTVRIKSTIQLLLETNPRNLRWGNHSWPPRSKILKSIVTSPPNGDYRASIFVGNISPNSPKSTKHDKRCTNNFEISQIAGSVLLGWSSLNQCFRLILI